MFSLSRGIVRPFGLALLGAGFVTSSLLAAPPAPSPAVPPATPMAGPAMGGGCCAPCPTTCCAPCPPPDVCTCTTYKPVCDTCYRTQPVVGYHDVCRTCYRQEPYCVTVPVTKVDCVTVDEGCYKMVWCPKPVTKQIPRVEYHQQVCSRTVPYTVTQRVPHVTTQVVPEYRVRYVPQTHTYVKPPCPTPVCCPPVAPGCGCPTPLSQASPNGYSSQAFASVPGGAQQAMPVMNPAPMVPNAGGHRMGTLPQVPALTAPAGTSQSLMASTGAAGNPYLGSQGAGNDWQAKIAVAAH